jgi:hypothetical protein
MKNVLFVLASASMDCFENTYNEYNCLSIWCHDCPIPNLYGVMDYCSYNVLCFPKQCSLHVCGVNPTQISIFIMIDECFPAFFWIFMQLFCSLLDMTFTD